jgi:hypothetical protein
MGGKFEKSTHPVCHDLSCSRGDQRRDRVAHNGQHYFRTGVRRIPSVVSLYQLSQAMTWGVVHVQARRLLSNTSKYSVHASPSIAW